MTADLAASTLHIAIFVVRQATEQWTEYQNQDEAATETDVLLIKH